jgi:hypothetical protein
MTAALILFRERCLCFCHFFSAHKEVLAQVLGQVSDVPTGDTTADITGRTITGGITPLTIGDIITTAGTTGPIIITDIQDIITEDIWGAIN